MTHIMIEDSSPEAKKLLAYVRTLPYVTVIDAKKKGFAEEAAACNAVPVSVFTQKLHSQIDEYFVGKNPIFLEYCTPISEPVPFFEAAQGIIGCSG